MGSNSDSDSDPDTVFVNLHIDEDHSFNAVQSKTEGLLSEGSWPWSKILIVGLIALCIIAIIIALIYFIVGKKFGKKPKPLIGTSNTVQRAINKDIGDKRKYQNVPQTD